MTLGRLAVLLVLASCRAHGSSGDQPGRSGKGLDVHVVDERGAPLAGMTVTAAYRERPGIVASACCVWVHFGEAVTGADGVARLPQPPASSGLELSALHPGWPRRTLRETDFLFAMGPLTIVLGPSRDLSGRVDLGDCVPGFVEVSAVAVEAGMGEPPVTAEAGSDGRFVVHGLGPGKNRVFLHACGREAHVDVDDTSQPGATTALLVLPPRDPRRPSYPSGRHSTSPGRAVAPARPPPATPCAPATGDLVMAGELDRVALDRRCRFLLVGRNVIEDRYEAVSWTLIRPGGAPLALGTSSRFSPPALGERIAVLSPPGEHISARVVELAGGAREEIGPLRRQALGASDALVLGGAGGAPPYGDTALDVRWGDGRREHLGDRVADGWFLAGDGRWLVYGIRSAGRSTEAHALDLTTRRDRLLARDADLMLSFGGTAAVVIGTGDRLRSWDLAAGGEGRVLVEPAAGWWPLAPDLLVKKEGSGRFRIWTSGESRLLPFRLAGSLDVARLRVTADHLLFGADGDAVLVDLLTGAGRLLGEGISLGSSSVPLLARGSLVLNENFGRVLLAPLDGGSARAVGRGIAHSVSPDGDWLAITQVVAARIDLVSTDGSRSSMQLSARGGTWAPDAPVFFHTGAAAYGDPRPLFAVFPAQQRTVTLEPRIIDYLPLSAREVLVVVPRGGKRAPGVWRVPVPAAP